MGADGDTNKRQQGPEERLELGGAREGTARRAPLLKALQDTDTERSGETWSQEGG